MAGRHERPCKDSECHGGPQGSWVTPGLYGAIWGCFPIFVGFYCVFTCECNCDVYSLCTMSPHSRPSCPTRRQNPALGVEESWPSDPHLRRHSPGPLREEAHLRSVRPEEDTDLQFESCSAIAFMQHIFLELLLCAKHCLEARESSVNIIYQPPCLHGT